MNSANFHEYLRNPSMLHQVSYQELKSLMLQYPYAVNLRYLILVKSLFDNHKEYDRNLALASLSSIDRKKLHGLVKEYSQVQESKENFEITEEFLELKDLSTLQDVLDTTPPSVEVPKAHAAPIANLDSKESDDFIDELLDSLPEEDKPQELQSEEEVENLSSIEELLDHGQVNEGELDIDSTKEQEIDVSHDSEDDRPLEAEDLSVPKIAPKDVPLEVTNDPEIGESGEDDIIDDEMPQPSPKAAFESWNQQSEESKEGILEKDLTIFEGAGHIEDLIEEYEEPKDVAKDVASNSLLEDGTIVTETFAGILERQGHFDKAIAMYEKLGLQYPEKSSFFAAKIKKLKKK